MMRIILLFLAICVIIFTPSLFRYAHLDPLYAREQSNPPGPVQGREIKLATIPKDYQEVKDVVFSADGMHVAYKARKADKEFIVFGNEPGRSFDSIMDSILLTSDGRRSAYHGRRKERSYLVFDGKERTYDDAGLDARPRGISPDGRFLAAQVMEKGMWSIVLFDWKRQIFRSSSHQWSYRSPVFSPDNRLLLYELGDKPGKKGGTSSFFVVDLKTGLIQARRVYESVIGDFAFSPDSSRLAYKMIKGGRYSLVLLDIAQNQERELVLPYGRYDQVESVRLSSSGRHVAYTAGKQGRAIMVVCDWDTPSARTESKSYDELTKPIFSPRGSRVAFSGSKNGGTLSVAVVGNREGPEYRRIPASPVFSPDGSKVAYAAMKNGKWFMVVSPADNPAKVKEGRAYDMVISPVFSPDGSILIYRARKGAQQKAERFIVIADKEGRVLQEGPICDEVWEPSITVDGRTAVYGARIGKELWRKVQALP